MPRPRKATQENNVEPLIQLAPEIDQEEEEDEELDNRTIATEQHRIVRTFVKHVPVEELTSEPEPAPAEAPATAAEFEPDAPPPHIARFLSEMGAASDRWQMVVYRLPEYHKDSRTDPARRKLCGMFDFTEDYEIEIQRRWARANTPNHFVVLVKKNGHYIKGGTLPVFSCEPAAVADRVNTPGDALPASTPQEPIYIVNDAPAQPAQPPINPIKQLKEYLSLQKEIREAFGLPNPANVTTAPAAAPDPEVALLQVLAKDGSLVDKLAKSTLGKLLGEGGAIERDPWAEVAMEAVKSGQGAQILSSAISALFAGFGGLVQRQQPEASAPMPPPQQQAPAPQPAPAVAQLPDQPIEMQVLALVINHCARSIPPQIAANRVMGIADQINEQAPAESIDGYLSMFANMETAAALEMVKSLAANGETVAALPHAAEWTAELQGLLRKVLEVAPDGE